jgi:hypothetical protein
MKSIMIVFLDWFEEPMNHTTPIFMSIAPALATRRRTTLHQQLHPPHLHLYHASAGVTTCPPITSAAPTID